MAWLAGFAAENGLARGVLSATARGRLVVSALLYVPGIAWPMALAGGLGLEAGWIGQRAGFYWTAFIAPFVLGRRAEGGDRGAGGDGGWTALAKRRA